MNIIVPIKQVPDLVEELEVDSSGRDLNREWLKFKLNEFDDHALEEALLMKEEQGGTVTAIAIDGDDIEKSLFAASAKGADRIVKVTGNFNGTVSSHQAAKALSNVISSMEYDVVMTGVQAADDRDGQVGVLLAHYLGIPHVSVVTGVTVSGNSLTVNKEYGGGVMAQFEVNPPVVLGIQAASQTPRYVPVARVRMAMKRASLDEVDGGDASVEIGSSVKRMFKPTHGAGAEMLEGSASDQANRIIDILKEKGIK
jgi:electron transfer flavoprotein beta subunit